jgi:hypothetical protein
MLKFDRAEAQELALNTQGAFLAMDDAMRMQARMTAICLRLWHRPPLASAISNPVEFEIQAADSKK